MRRVSMIVVLSLCTLLFASIISAQQASAIAATTTASVPNLIRYSGTLKDAQGAALVSTAPVGVTFAIYNQEDGGAAVWQETQNVTPEANGQYSVILGSTTATGLPTDLFSEQEQRWLGVQVQGQSEQPRVLLVSVPYAFKAHEAETLGGRSVSDFVLANGANPVANAPNNSQPPTLTASTNPANNGTRKGAASDGPTNFSGSTTDQIVGVTQSGTGNAIVASTSNTTSSSDAVQGTISGPGVAIYGSASSTSAQAYGVQGNSASTIGIGLLGFATATTGSTYGLKGYSSSTGGTGVRGLSTATTGSTTGISASVASAAGTAGVFNNTAGGKILSGQNNGVQKFSVDGSGNVNASGTFTGNGSALTGIAFTQLGGQLTSAQLNGTYSNALNLTNSQNNLTGNGAGLTGISFSNLSGSLASSQLSGTYSAPVNLANVSNSYSGSGASLSGIVFPQIVGTLGSSQFSGTYSNAVTLSNTNNVFYGDGTNLNIRGGVCGNGCILNQTTQQANANFNISGSGTANIFNAASYQIGSSQVLSIGNAANFNLFVGVNAGASTSTGAGNTFAGYEAGLQNGAGSYNTYSGYTAGYNAAGGVGNTFTGAQAGYNSYGLSYSTYTGYQAGYSTSSGYYSQSYNTYTGADAGYANATGYENVFTGADAGYSSSGGIDNVFDGVNTGYSDTGSYNSFYGTLAGYNNTAGSYNIFLGYQGGYNNVGGNSDIYIGNAGPTTTGENNTIRIGTQGTSSGQQNVTYIAGIFGSTSGGGTAVYIDSTGQLGTQTSSRRFKEQIADMGDSTSALMKLRPVSFFYKPEYTKGDRTLQYGLIAEEVAQVYPGLVAYDNDGKPYTVRYQYLAPMLLNEVQKQYRRAEEQSEIVATQQLQIKAQRQEIDSLKHELQLQNTSLQERLSKLESYVATQTQMKTASDVQPSTTASPSGDSQ